MITGLLVALLALSGCDGDAPSTQARGPDTTRSGSGTVAPTDEKARPRNAPRSPTAPLRRREQHEPLVPEHATGPIEIVQEGAPGEQEAPPERDYGAELRAQLGSAAQCVHGSTAARIVANVTVVFTELGRATRADVSIPGATEDAVRCVRDRALATRLNGPVPGAPRAVSATLELTRTP